MMWRDKRAAKGKLWRTPEKYFWFIALLGGSLGIFLGTRSPIYHKAAKQSFTIGIPILILVQVVMVWVLGKY